jgi:hypothetical protein
MTSVFGALPCPALSCYAMLLCPATRIRIRPPPRIAMSVSWTLSPWRSMPASSIIYILSLQILPWCSVPLGQTRAWNDRAECQVKRHRRRQPAASPPGTHRCVTDRRVRAAFTNPPLSVSFAALLSLSAKTSIPSPVSNSGPGDCPIARQ